MQSQTITFMGSLCSFGWEFQNTVGLQCRNGPSRTLYGVLFLTPISVIVQVLYYYTNYMCVIKVFHSFNRICVIVTTCPANNVICLVYKDMCAVYNDTCSVYNVTFSVLNVTCSVYNAIFPVYKAICSVSELLLCVCL